MVEDYRYIEPEEKTNRRYAIRKAQRPIEELIEFVDKGAKEQEIQKLLKLDLSFMSDVFASPCEEFICLPEYDIGKKRIDFMVLTGRSRMQVCMIEIKGADFYTTKRNHYHGMTAHIHDAIGQITAHEKYIKENYDSFRKHIHDVRDLVITEKYKSAYLIGPSGELYVDPNKDIKLRKAVIGGKSYEEYTDSRERTSSEQERYNSIEIFSWESFIRRLDKQHGHYF